MILKVFYFSNIICAIVISNCTFLNNVANFDGGAIYFLNSFYLSISNSTFEKNRALNGGSISIKLNFKDSLGLFEIYNNLFQFNNAKEGGGCLIFDGKFDSRLFEFLKNNSFFENTARYGLNIATFPSRMTVDIISSQKGNETSANIELKKDLFGYSGLELDQTFFISFFDHFNQPVLTNKDKFILQIIKILFFIFRYSVIILNFDSTTGTIDSEKQKDFSLEGKKISLSENGYIF